MDHQLPKPDPARLEMQHRAYLARMFQLDHPGLNEDYAQIIAVQVCTITVDHEARVQLAGAFSTLLNQDYSPLAVAEGVYRLRMALESYDLDPVSVLAAAEEIVPGIAVDQAMERIEQEEASERLGCTVAMLSLVAGWAAIALTDGAWWVVIGWAAFCVGLFGGVVSLHTMLTRKEII